jgi:hypothetical protein
MNLRRSKIKLKKRPTIMVDPLYFLQKRSSKGIPGEKKDKSVLNEFIGRIAYLLVTNYQLVLLRFICFLTSFRIFTLANT